MKPIIPTTPTSFFEVARNTEFGPELYQLVNTRPIVTWFARKGRKAVHQLVKVGPALGDNRWMVTGHDYSAETELMVTLGVTTLRRALGYLTPENGWVLCEFQTGCEFHRAVLEYLDGPAVLPYNDDEVQ